jgi:hypothetical protein
MTAPIGVFCLGQVLAFLAKQYWYARLAREDRRRASDLPARAKDVSAAADTWRCPPVVPNFAQVIVIFFLLLMIGIWLVLDSSRPSGPIGSIGDTYQTGGRLSIYTLFSLGILVHAQYFVAWLWWSATSGIEGILRPLSLRNYEPDSVLLLQAAIDHLTSFQWSRRLPLTLDALDQLIRNAKDRRVVADASRSMEYVAEAERLLLRPTYKYLSSCVTADLLRYQALRSLLDPA